MRMGGGLVAIPLITAHQSIAPVQQMMWPYIVVVTQRERWRDNNHSTDRIEWFCNSQYVYWLAWDEMRRRCAEWNLSSGHHRRRTPLIIPNNRGALDCEWVVMMHALLRYLLRIRMFVPWMRGDAGQFLQNATVVKNTSRTGFAEIAIECSPSRK